MYGGRALLINLVIILPVGMVLGIFKCHLDLQVVDSKERMFGSESIFSSYCQYVLVSIGHHHLRIHHCIPGTHAKRDETHFASFGDCTWAWLLASVCVCVCVRVPNI